MNQLVLSCHANLGYFMLDWKCGSLLGFICSFGSWGRLSPWDLSCQVALQAMSRKLNGRLSAQDSYQLVLQSLRRACWRGLSPSKGYCQLEWPILLSNKVPKGFFTMRAHQRCGGQRGREKHGGRIPGRHSFMQLNTMKPMTREE